MKKLLTLIAFALVAFTANAQSTLKGDVNGDGEVNVTDVTMIVEYVLGQHNSSFIVANADANGDGDITVTDVAEAVNIILDGNGGDNNGSGDGSGIGDTSQAYLTCPDSNHPHMIDLGLPSGTKWACCNVGATKPEEYGGYYAWGETEEKSDYSAYYYQYTYLYNHNELGNCTIDEDGYKWYDIAGTQYDVAHMKWGGSWVMPSKDQVLELIDNCKTVIEIENDDCTFTGPSGGCIFLPGAGIWMGDEFRHYDGHYWSSTRPNNNGPIKMWFRYTFENGAVIYSFIYPYGLTVRPVWVP